ncbi:WhiB family transcriptional regulator [Embleya sp. NPDC059259]|uniref:WhiB family transcriptional regulator n=1 Tax=unclassified Embleya TaxID=2699296 RepID=UPI0036AB14DC
MTASMQTRDRVIMRRWVSAGSGPWEWDAACRGADPELFVDDAPYGTGNVNYPDKTRAARVRQALAICAGCPVRRQCLDDAVAAGDRWAIRGGLTVALRMPDSNDAADAA